MTDPKKRLLIRLDDAMLDVANGLLRRFQDATGIPKWKASRLVMSAWGAMLIVEGVTAHHTLMIVFGPLLLVSAAIATRERAEQKRADRSMMPILSANRDDFVMRSLRLLWSLLIIVCAIEILRGRRQLASARDVMIFLTVFLMSCDTWPMTGGSTIRDRIKSLFAAKPMSTVESET